MPFTGKREAGFEAAAGSKSLRAQLQGPELPVRVNHVGPGWEQAKALVQTWGAPVLAFSALFPDSPRASIVVATLAGLPPLTITAWVLVGKLVLYGVLAWGVVRLPQWSRSVRWSQGSIGSRLQRMNRRLLALRRLLSRAPPSSTPTWQEKPP